MGKKQEQKQRKFPWVLGLWVALAASIVVIASVIVDAKAGGYNWYNWCAVMDISEAVRDIIIIVFAYLITALSLWSPEKTAICGLLFLTFVFLFASANSSVFAEKMRDFISNVFNLDYLVGSLTFLALLLAVTSLKKKKE